MEANLAWLEDPEVFRVNRLDAHSDHSFYETEEDQRAGRESLRQSLNGEWRFRWSEKPGERPADFWKDGADLSGFGSILVPGHMELAGYGKVHYINTVYPWDGHCFLRPPHVDWEQNPVGSYVKEFDLDGGLCGKRLCISFQGVEEAMYVWLNGVFVGYAEDSFTPSEFDLTGLVKETGNRLCMEVYKRSSAAWIEDQDFFRFSGIFREVYLYAKPRVHVEDLWVKAGLGEDYATGTLEAEVKVSGEEAGRIAWTLEDPDGKKVCEGELKQAGHAGPGLADETPERAGVDAGYAAGSQESAEQKVCVWNLEPLTIPEVRKWDLGEGNLYRIVLKVFAADGHLAEVVPYRIGFRRFEIREKIMLLNGKRLIINGVNRHEWNPRRGRSITADDMKKDIEVLKRNHINAVRTCHYPNQSLWYQLCDEAGICVMDETNLESHGSWQKMGRCEPSWNVPGASKVWEACVVDRAASMLERDKNHPSILWWSCGNESYAGPCILAMSQYFHEKDPSRRVHYEGVFWNREFQEISDVESRMYATPEEIRTYLENDPQKPYLLCEYMHDMGNSLGGMESYRTLLDEFPMYQGGFIWDYMDQAIYYKNAFGEEVLGYGGDFLDRPTDYAFSGNGIVFADRTEKPAMQEVRYWYAAPEEREAIRRENERLREIAEAECARAVPQNTGKLQVIHGDVHLGLKGTDFEMLFSFQEGGPVSIVYDGEECLYRAPRPAFWRAATENDKGNGFDTRSSVWMAADQFSKCTDIRVEEYAKDRTDVLDVTDFAGRKPAAEDIERVTITYTYTTRTVPETEAAIAYTVDGSGRIRTELHYSGKKGLPELPVFGLRIVMPKRWERVAWQGLSGETYPDRKAGGRFGVQEEAIAIADYLVPQECGNHMDTCWAKVGPMRIRMDGTPFHFSALPYTAVELENALHKEELPRSARTVVTVLGRMRGVGGIDSWGADVEAPYHVSAEEDICCSFYIEKA
ncbi:MAG: glycoside hydrolase family 2 TIM barrel-domain containing protein [Eubacteriales bacterium]|nr:glycoside hydrolase family 2 TIM barrel-domain containing protein [Eubacteriales bacterium]